MKGLSKGRYDETFAGEDEASMVSRILGNPSAVHCVAIHDSIWITENLYCVMVNSV